MKITLTGIYFIFDNGFGEDYTGVNLNFNNSGATFNLSGYVKVTKDQYKATNGDIDQLLLLVKQEILNRLQESSEV